MDIFDLTVKQLSDKALSGEISPSEICDCFLRRINDSDLNAFITVPDNCETKIKNGILSGIPFGVKDNICTRGITTTCGSKMLENFVPPYDATAVKLLKNAGGVVFGKLNMDEFGMGSSSEKSYFGAVKNPHNPEFVTGGSSGGSAASVAAGLVPFALGSDTGGSVRLPAAFCGVVGLKPSYGLVSRYGLVSFAPSLDHVGIITGDVYDAAFLLGIMAGFDIHDSTSVKRSPECFTDGIDNGVKNVRIAIPEEYLENIDDDVKKSVLDAAKLLQKEGAEIEYVSLDFLKSALAAYYIISSAESSSNLARFDGVRYGFRATDCGDMSQLYKKSRSEGFGDEVKRRIMMGTFVLSRGYYDEYYKKAQQVRDSVTRRLEDLFEKFDFILSPVSPVVCYKQKSVVKPTDMYYQDMFNVPANLAGIPAVSVPCGKDGNGMPLGVQLIGKRFSEKELLRVAFTLERCAGRWDNAKL